MTLYIEAKPTNISEGN